MRHLNASAAGFEAEFLALLDRGSEQQTSVDQRVTSIIEAVRARGDEAVLEYTRQLDRNPARDMAALTVSHARMNEAFEALTRQDRQALEQAAERIAAFAESQKLASHRYRDEFGSELGQLVRPVARAGVYVPGGKAAYPSSVLMNAIPARVAEVGEIIMVSPASDGDINPWVLAAAAVAGVDRFLTIGGAQAVAALAYGTQTIPEVDKIVGPGNAYVASAKRQVFGQVGIESVAGPSEVLIIADGSGDPEWVALDVFAQAEHDEMARAIVISPDADYLDAVKHALDENLAAQPRRDIIQASLQNNGALIGCRDLSEAVALSNRVAPEHLELAVADPEALLADIQHAGAIFAGHHSAEVFGDYCAGPNHVLPTARTARFSSALGPADFQKRISLLSASQQGAVSMADTAVRLAQSEGLYAHAASAEARRRG